MQYALFLQLEFYRSLLQNRLTAAVVVGGVRDSSSLSLACKFDCANLPPPFPKATAAAKASSLLARTNLNR